MQYKLLWKHSSMPIKWSVGCSLDLLACHVFSQKADDKLWCGGWFLLLKLAFYLLASDFFPIDVTQAYKTHFSLDFIPKICFCCTFKLHLVDRFGISKTPPMRYRVEEGEGLRGVNWCPHGECKALASREHSVLPSPNAWGWHFMLCSSPSLWCKFNSYMWSPE